MPLELAREIARQGEVRLSALLTIGLAADSRANTLCGLLGASCAAVLGGSIAYLSQDHVSQKVVAAAFVAAIVLFVAASLAAFAGSPRDFYVVGGQLKKLRLWSWTGDGWRDEVEMLEATAMRYSLLIERDSRALDRSTKRFMLGIYVALLSLPLSVLAYILT
jgi:hypothetical protein